MSGESSREAYTGTYVNRWPVGMCCMTQGTQTGALCNLEGEMGKRWEGGSRGGDICTPMADSC